MESAQVVAVARHGAGFTTRELAERAGTSHATITAYEKGRKVPRVDTLGRVLNAAGFRGRVVLEPRPDGGDAGARWRELRDALELAAVYPTRHGRRLRYPRFGVDR